MSIEVTTKRINLLNILPWSHCLNSKRHTLCLPNTRFETKEKFWNVVVVFIQHAKLSVVSIFKAGKWWLNHRCLLNIFESEMIAMEMLIHHCWVISMCRKRFDFKALIAQPQTSSRNFFFHPQKVSQSILSLNLVSSTRLHRHSHEGLIYVSIRKHSLNRSQWIKLWRNAAQTKYA